MVGVEVARHVMVVRQERQGLVYKPECRAPKGASCRVTEFRDVVGFATSVRDDGTCHLVDWLNDDPGLIPEMNSEEFEIARIPFRWSGDFEDGGWMRSAAAPCTCGVAFGTAEGPCVCEPSERDA